MQRQIIGIITLVIVCLWFWYTGFIEHGKGKEAWEIINRPRVIGVLFNGFKGGNDLSIRGIVLQIFAYIMLPLITLTILGVLSRQSMATILVFTALLSLCFIGIQWWVKK
jgi:hypothetical protein